MATINSHRRRQVYGRSLSYQSYSRYGYTNSPTGAATMMPSKETRVDDYSAYKRDFAEIRYMTSSTFLGNTLKRVYDRSSYGSNAAYNDILRTAPGGFINPNDPHAPMRHHQSTGTSRIMYISDMTGAGGYIGYDRRRTGIIKSYYTHKKVGRGGSYQQVIDIGSHIGGNIKSRQGTLKWIGGIWREKK